MKRLILGCLLLATPSVATAQSVDEQIAEAVLAAPESLRDAATVIIRDAQGRPSIIRQGTNALVCEPDGPQTPGFLVQCFHESLQGVTDFINTQQAAGAAPFSGSPPVNETSPGSMRYALIGPTRDQAVPHINIYLPYATSESTGLPTDEQLDGSPWLMWPGTPDAHFMFEGRPPGAPLEYPFK